MTTIAIPLCSILPLLVPATAGPQESDPGCTMPANPAIVRVRQPWGDEVALRFRGDGFHAWYEDLGGYPVVRRRDTYLYALVDAEGELQPTSLAVGRGEPGRAGLRRDRPSGGAAPRRAVGGKARPRDTGSNLSLTTGTTDNLVLLLRFADHGPGGQNRTLPSEADVEVILNAPGGDPLLAPTGSVRDYYLEASYGAFTFDSDAVGWLDVPGGETYYAAGSSGLSSTVHELIEDGLEAADPLVDFSLFDQDADGMIDAITILHSGYGAEWGGVDVYGTDYTDRIWSHKWSIPTWTSDEGVSVEQYNISPGLWDVMGDEPGHIGVVVHELGHYIGLPDLYDTDGSSVGIGHWDAMASGAWGFDGSQQYPSHLSAWSKWKLGWLDATVIVPGTYVADPVEENPTAYRIQSGYPTGESILIENRQPILFDAQVPQAGLAIWHVDDAKGSIADNDVNNDEGFAGQAGWPANGKHYRNALLQPDDFWDLEQYANTGDGGDVYHEAGVAEITSSSSPGLDSYQDGLVVATGNEILDVEDVPGGIAFTYQDVLAPTITTSGLGSIWGTFTTTFAVSAIGGTGALSWSEVLVDPTYAELPGTGSAFVAVGQPQGWHADDATWELLLPFPFPYYGETHDRLWVSSNGFVDFVSSTADAYNQRSHLRFARRIAPLWDDLRTDGPGEDVFVDVRQDELEVRWAASTFATGDPVHVALVLGADGRVTFHYGPGNTNLTPTVGLSRGHGGGVIHLAGYDGSASLGLASSHAFVLEGSRLPPGMELLPDGTLIGAPTSLGTYRPLLRVTDALGRFDQREIPIDVVARPEHRSPRTRPGR